MEYWHAKDHELFETLSANIQLGEPPTRVTVVVAPSRSGSTLFARTLAELGVETWYQPVKAMLRNLRINVQSQFEPQSTQFALKETLGAYTLEEARMNPVEVLLRAGVPNHVIHVVLLARDPVTVAASTIENFSWYAGAPDLIGISIQGYRTLIELREFCLAQNIEVTSFVYEALATPGPEKALRALLPRLGLEYRQRLTDWPALESLQELKHLRWVPEPEGYYEVDFFKQVRRGGGVQYVTTDNARIRRLVSDANIERMSSEGAMAAYQELRRQSELDLHINVTCSSWIDINKSTPE